MSANPDGRVVVFGVHSRVQVMVDGGKDYIVPNQRAIPNLNPALILKVTGGVRPCRRPASMHPSSHAIFRPKFRMV